MIPRWCVQLYRLTVPTLPSTSRGMTTVVNRGFCGKVIPNCWSCLTCKNARSTLFCDKCGQLQPPSKVNLFEYVGIQARFDIDESEVKKKLIQLSSKIHPDKFSTATQREKDLSEEHTRLLSTARSMLNDPVKRGRYLIQLAKGDKHIHVEDDDVQKRESFSPEILMEIFELNEKVEDALNEKEKEEILKEIGERRTEMEKRITNALKKGSIDEAEKEINKLAYLQSIRMRLMDSIRG
uniref:Dnj-15 n=1 Tax=Pristionchus pacificus TaxID=54126 RepID=A0A2A6BE68_PRIPA|eukprot:PDM64146.1 dnj-15 [Pristionchus pacificus]